MRMFLFLCLFFCSLFSTGQQKGDSKIIVKGICYDSVLIKLLDAGYFIDKKDTSLKTAITNPKKYNTKGSTCNLIIQVRVKDSVCYITGLSNMDAVINDFLVKGNTIDYRTYEPVVNIGMKGSPAKEAFNTLDKFAKSLNGQIFYSK